MSGVRYWVLTKRPDGKLKALKPITWNLPRKVCRTCEPGMHEGFSGTTSMRHL